MKVGASTASFVYFVDLGLDFEGMLDKAKEIGVETLEMGAGPYTGGNKYFDVDRLLESPDALSGFKAALEERELSLSALQCHGNPVHPDAAFAEASHLAYVKHLKIAEKLGIDTLVMFSGCPGDGPTATHPNWVTCTWPPEFVDVLRWQWDESLVPYWKKAGAQASEHGVKIALELHPGFAVYNTATLLQLREAAGPAICAALDVGHLFEVGIDPISAVRELGPVVAHVHAKDLEIDTSNMAVNGFIDTTAVARGRGAYGAMPASTHRMRTIGYGHDLLWWRRFVSALRMEGYDKVLSIEQVDPLAPILEGLSKSVKALKEAVFTAPGWSYSGGRAK
jgi:sugar phosphate isomerase/epimerase